MWVNLSASPPVNRKRFQHFDRAACAATATKVDDIGQSPARHGRIHVPDRPRIVVAASRRENCGGPADRRIRVELTGGCGKLWE